MSEPIVIEHGEHADWIHLKAGKANALGPTLVDAWDDVIPLLLSCDEPLPARAVVLTGEGSAFSAGLDLPSLITLSRAELARFCERLSRVFLSLALSPRPVIAAINGHAVAGGLVLALSCDHRIAATHVTPSGKPCRLGLKETALGLPFPPVAAAIVAQAIPHRSSLLELTLTGDLFATERALELGIVDRAVRPESWKAEIHRATVRYAQGTGAAVRDVKRQFSEPLVVLQNAMPSNEVFLDAWFSEVTQWRLRDVVESLNK